eukprot:GEMP01001476.1.p1 GENE.GEMP01001476.1~~GEMP01001476.1.p1  ORF type:complete len:1431 (+),score=332.07 GEMP01001476.1:293-4585(+)
MVDVAGQPETSANPGANNPFVTNSASNYQALWQQQKGENERLRLSLVTLEEKTSNADKWEKDAKDYKQRYFGIKIENARMRDKLHNTQTDLDKLRRATRATMASEEGDGLTTDLATQLEEAQNALKGEQGQVQELKQRCSGLSDALDDVRRSQSRIEVLQKENDFRAEIDELKESLAESQYQDAVSTSLLAEKSDTAAHMSDVLKEQNAEITSLRESVAHVETEAGKSHEEVESLESDKAALLTALQVAKGHINELFKEAEDAHHKIDTYGDPKELRDELEKTEEELLMSDATFHAQQDAHVEALTEVNALEEKFADKSFDLAELKMEADKYSEEQARDAENYAVQQSEMKEDNEMLRTSLRVQTGLIVELERERDAFQYEFQEMESLKNDAQMQLVQEVQHLRRSLSAGDPRELLQANSELSDHAAVLHVEKEERAEEWKKLQEKVELLQMTIQITEAERDYLHSMHLEHAATLKERDSHTAQLEADYATLENDNRVEIAKSEEERRGFLHQLDFLECEKQRLERVSISTSDQLLGLQDEQLKAESHLRSLYALTENKTESSAKLLEAFGNDDMKYLEKLGHLEATMDELLNHAEEREDMERQNESLRRKVEMLENKHYSAMKELEDQQELRNKVDNLIKALESRSYSDASLSIRSGLLAYENRCRTSKNEALQKQVKHLSEKNQRLSKEIMETEGQTDSLSQSNPEREPSPLGSKKFTERISELQRICLGKLEKLKKERALSPFSLSRGSHRRRGLSAPPLRNDPRAQRPSIGFSFPSSPVSLSSHAHTMFFGGRHSSRTSLRASTMSSKTNSPGRHSEPSLTVRSSPGSLERSRYTCPALNFRASLTPQPPARLRILEPEPWTTPIPIPRPPQRPVGPPLSHPLSRPSSPPRCSIAHTTATPYNILPPFAHQTGYPPSSWTQAGTPGSRSPYSPDRVSVRGARDSCCDGRALPMGASWSRELSREPPIRLSAEGITPHVLPEKAPPRLRPSAKLTTPAVFSAIRTNSATRGENNCTMQPSAQGSRVMSPHLRNPPIMASMQLPLRRTIAIGTGSALRMTLGGFPPPMTLYPVARQNSAPHTPRTEGTTMPSPMMKPGMAGISWKPPHMLERSSSMTRLFQFQPPSTYSTPCSPSRPWQALIPIGTNPCFSDLQGSRPQYAPAEFQQEIILPYDIETFDFVRLVIALLGEPAEIDLSMLHKTERFISLRKCYGNTIGPRINPWNGRFLGARRKGSTTEGSWDAFIDMYHDFVRTAVLDNLQTDCVAFQACPSFRCHLPQTGAVGRPHCDADYHHTPSEVNFWVPLTSVWGTNSLQTESRKGLGDFHAVCAEPGQCLRFYGNQVWHYNVNNDTDSTRVSIDFRVIRIEEWTPEAFQRFRFGEYFAIMTRQGVLVNDSEGMAASRLQMNAQMERASDVTAAIIQQCMTAQ